MPERLEWRKNRFVDPETFMPKLSLTVTMSLEIWQDENKLNEKTEDEVIDEVTEYFKTNMKKYFREVRIKEKLKRI